MRQAELPQVVRFCPRGGWSSALAWAILLLSAELASAQPAGALLPPGAAPPGAEKKKQAPPPPPPAPIDAPATTIDPQTKLPVGYQPPGDKPDLMTLDKPLLSAPEIDALRRLEGKYKQAMRGTDLNEANKDLLRKGLKYRLALLCEKDNRNNLHTFRERLLNEDLRQAGVLSQRGDPYINFRTFVLTELTKQTELLLDNNLYVRIQAVTLLGELTLTESDLQRGTKLEAFTPALDPLVRVLGDANQPLAVKIAAARSVIRLLRFGTPSVPLKHQVASVAIAQLKDPTTHFWYQMRLVEALGLVDVTLDLNERKPFVVNALRGVMNDPKRDWQVRAQAVKSLGRVPFDAQVDVNATMREIAQFSLDLAKAAQQKPESPLWKSAFVWVYLGFQAADGTDRDALKRNRGGLKNNPQVASQAEPVYQLILPLVNKLINDQRITADQVKSLEDWVNKNKPIAANQAQRPGIAAPPSATSAQ